MKCRSELKPSGALSLHCGGAGGCDGWQLSGSLQQISNPLQLTAAPGRCQLEGGRRSQQLLPSRWPCLGQWPLAAAFTAASLLDLTVTDNLVSCLLVPDIMGWESKGSLRKEVLRLSKEIHHSCPSYSGQLSCQELVNVVCVRHVKNSHHIANTGVSVKCIA